MNVMKLLAIPLLLCLSCIVQAQNVQKDYAADQVMSWNSKAGANTSNIVMGFDERTGKLKGDVYLEEEWQLGDLKLKNGMLLEDLWMRYDLMSNYLEIRTEKAVKVLNEDKVASFTLMNEMGSVHTFTNADQYVQDDVELLGVFEVLADGQYKLFARPELKIKEPNYVPAFDVGTMDTKILKDKTYYLAKGNEVLEVKGNQKKLMEFFNEKPEELQEFMKRNRLSFKDPIEASQIVSHYNSWL
jgi:hypothetical protein